MARRRGRRRRNISQTLFIVLGILVALTMVLSYLLEPISRMINSNRPTPTVVFLPTSTPAPPTPSESEVEPAPSPAPRPVATVAPHATPISLNLGDKYTFAVAGDSRDGDDVYSYVLEAVAQDGSEFLVHTGDIVSDGREKQWAAWQGLMEGFELPFYPVPGNHDSSGGLLEDYLKYSGAPAQRYSVDAGPVHLSLVDSYSGALLDSTLDWLDEDLARSSQPVKMIVFHHPPFDPDGTDHTLQMGAGEVMSLAEEHDVDYVVTGHIHAYAEEERNGVQYIVTGGAGAPIYDSEHPEGAFYHYVRFTVDGSRMSHEVVPIEF